MPQPHGISTGSPHLRKCAQPAPRLPAGDARESIINYPVPLLPSGFQIPEIEIQVLAGERKGPLVVGSTLEKATGGACPVGVGLERCPGHTSLELPDCLQHPGGRPLGCRVETAVPRLVQERASLGSWEEGEGRGNVQRGSLRSVTVSFSF